ncbi:MAG: ribonuclease [Rhodospirillales bacterium]|nr:ribonuclease [Rhodospirillales bacterium]
MAKRMLIDATHSEETRVVVLDGTRLEEFDFETSTKKQIKGNIYLAKITRVEPSLQAAFVEFGGNRHGFLAFSEIHPDYYRIPVGDRDSDREPSGRESSGRESGRGERRERRRPDRRRREPPVDGVIVEHGEFQPEGLEHDAETRGADEDRSDEHGSYEHDSYEQAGHEDGGPEGDHGHAGSDEAHDHDGHELHAHEHHAHEGHSHDHDSDEPQSDDPEPHDHGERADIHAETTASAEEGVADENRSESEQQPERDQLRAERSAPDEITALPADIESPYENGSNGETQSEALGFGPTSSDDEADAARGEAEMPAPVEVPREAPAEAFETLGGDDFEEAARQRSRSMRHYKIQEVIKRRQIILVQVTKEERGNKGAALTTYLSLAGRYCVLMPNTGRGGGVSRKITSATDRRRLKDILEDLELPDGMGVIVRTAGSERSKPEIKRDFEYLLRLWDEIRSLTLQSTAPALIYEEGNLIKRSIRDLYARDIDEVLIDGEEGYRTAKAFMKMLMPSHAKRVQPYRDPTPLFHRYAVEGQIDLIHSPVVQLKSGGYIVINPTEALVAIDVNSGRSTKERNIEETATRTNLEAADEVARQLRLRDLAGLIVVDFIDMEEHRNQAAVERRIKDAMKWDRARIQLGRISAFGLLELSRQRLRPSLLEASTLPCPHCSGTGTIRSTESTALHVLRAIEEEGIRRRTAEACIYVPTSVALYVLNQKREALAQIEARYGFHVAVSNDDTLIPPAFRLERLRSFTPAELATLPIPVAPPPRVEDDDDDVVEDDEETVETVAAASHGEDATSESGEELSEEERGRRRRRRRRRRRPDDDAAPQDGTAGEDDRDDAIAAADESEDDEHHEGAPRLDDAAGDELAGSEAVSATADGDAPGRKRRRRGKRGGRRRHGDELEADSSAPAVEQIEIVDQPVTAGSASVNDEVEAAFSSPPVSVGDDMADTAQAPVFDGGEALHHPAPATEAEHRVEASPPAPEQPKARAHEPAEVETVEAVPAEAAPAPKGSTMPEATLVVEKPKNPKRGWWGRLIQP